MDSFWRERAREYAEVMAQSSSVQNAHAYILSRVADARSVLDFCCGDGLLASKVRSSARLAVYEQSKTFLALVKARLAGRPVEFYSSAEGIPSAQFDSVILCFVLMSFRSSEWAALLRHVRRCKTADGRVITVVTHPCFRDRRFSYYRTSCGEGRQFDYFDEDAAFTVTMDAAGSGVEQSFTNFHHSITALFSRFSEAGFVATEVQELADTGGGARSEGLAPPYLGVVWRSS